MTVPLHFKIYGSGDPLIILHGFLGSLDNWQSIARKLAEEYMVIRVDQRNHGKSPHSDAFSYNLMVEDLKAFMESEWIYSAHILGHSMGGKTAMNFAQTYPDMVEKLVIVDIAPKAYTPGHHSILAALSAVPIETIDSRKSATSILSQHIEDPSVLGFLMKNLQRNGQGYSWKINLPILTKNYANILEPVASDTFDKPTLFVRGANSNYITDEDKDLIDEIFTLSSLTTIENAGHWIHADQPEDFLKAVGRFLEN